MIGKVEAGFPKRSCSTKISPCVSPAAVPVRGGLSTGLSTANQQHNYATVPSSMSWRKSMATQSVTGNPSRWLPVRCSGRSYSNQLSAIGIAHTHPGVAHLLVVHHRIVDQDVEPEPRHR